MTQLNFTSSEIMASKLRLLVLGATGAIGGAVVKSAAHVGFSIVAFGRSRGKLMSLKGPDEYIEFDANDIGAIDYAFRQLADRGFVPDAAVNCFGITRRNPFLSQRVEQWEEVVNVNLRGTWRCMQHEAQAMLNGGGGSIVNVASVAGFRGNGWGEAPYVASKHGVIGLTRTAAVELGLYGIRVNAVCPSIVETPMVQDGEFSGQRLQNLAEKHPFRRLITPAEIAQTALWLCSDNSSGISGAIIPVDGGLTAS